MKNSLLCSFVIDRSLQYSIVFFYVYPNGIFCNFLWPLLNVCLLIWTSLASLIRSHSLLVLVRYDAVGCCRTTEVLKQYISEEKYVSEDNRQKRTEISEDSRPKKIGYFFNLFLKFQKIWDFLLHTSVSEMFWEYMFFWFPDKILTTKSARPKSPREKKKIV